ncbi:DUF3291 domain-containing protein [Conexibacter sp. SYSU D00693]|uniref:DUF3291 domain-containing protein n=1 Tax=Conexibacter sp. SYSU D00693 TaxID=2812560 RepID=UPI00196B350C|nr:DUF3291 domain-containing protein [Conexibacter sp. SYSU D00693]
MAWHLAQLNVAVALEPLDSPRLAEFTAQLDPVNASADAAPGFVWRMQDDSGNATDLRGSDDELLLNMSVWRSFEDLRAFVYGDAGHLAVMRRRREWFAKLSPVLVLWWVPAGRLPTIPEAEARRALLAEQGPTPEAFTFRHAFPPPDAGAAQTHVDAGDALRPA